MKVCHVAMGDLWAGAEVQLLTLMKYLIRLPDFEGFVILFNEGRLADELRKLPISLIVIPEKRHGPIAIAYRLAMIFRRIRPDIVHTHKYKDSILGTIMARCVGVPHVVRVVHGMPEPFAGCKNLMMVGYTLADRVVTKWLIDKVIAVSLDIKTVLAKAYGEDRVVCIHNGIDLEVVKVLTKGTEKRLEWHINEKVVLIGTVGRLVPVKGYAILLKAFRSLCNSNPDLMLILVGDGPLRKSLETDVKKLGLQGSVVFAGYQDHTLDFINMMDIFVLPSLHEGIPMVLLEALALHRPVIASAVGGIPEVVDDTVSGMLITPSDVEALANGLLAMIQNPKMTMELGMAGREVVAQKFTANGMALRTAEMYRSLCSAATQ